MLPITELAAQQLRGIFCDVDDTLTHRGALVPEAYQAVCDCARAGLRVVLVTGRPAGWASVLASTWPIDGAIGENGAVAFRRWEALGRTFIGRNFWDSDEVRAASQPKLAAIRDRVLAEVPRARLADDQWLRITDLAFDIGESQSLPAEEIAAIVSRIVAGGARSLVSTVHAHAFIGDHDKARMCVRIAREWWDEDLDATRQDYLFVGDSPNDQACFAYFPVSAGVANVKRYAELSPAPVYLASAEGGHGFAEIAQVILAARTSPSPPKSPA